MTPGVHPAAFLLYIEKMKLTTSIILFALILITGCTLTFDDGRKPLRIKWITPQNSTVSLTPVLMGVFSGPVADSSTQFTFTPPVPSAYTIFHAGHDTFEVHPGALLEGNTRFTVRPARPIVSDNGATLNPSDDSLSIVTHAGEHEPNNSFSTADTVDSVICGTFLASNDTDWFLCPGPVDAVTMIAAPTRAVATILTMGHDSIATTIRDADSSTVTIQQSDSMPLYIRVQPSLSVANGAYLLRITRR